MLARLKELQQRQQQLNEQLAQAAEGEQEPGPSGDSAESTKEGKTGKGEQDSAAGDKESGTESDQDGTKEGGKESDQDGTKGGGKDSTKEGAKEGDKDSAKEGDQESTDTGRGDAEDAAGEQNALSKSTGEVADQLTEMPLGKSATDANDVAGELRRAKTFQENAASAIVGGRLGEATRLGGDGSAAIAEAIDKLEALVFAGRKSGNEAESYPDGYEQLIQEYLRAISYE